MRRRLGGLITAQNRRGRKQHPTSLDTPSLTLAPCVGVRLREWAQLDTHVSCESAGARGWLHGKGAQQGHLFALCSCTLQWTALGRTVSRISAAQIVATARKGACITKPHTRHGGGLHLEVVALPMERPCQTTSRPFSPPPPPRKAILYFHTRACTTITFHNHVVADRVGGVGGCGWGRAHHVGRFTRVCPRWARSCPVRTFLVEGEGGSTRPRICRSSHPCQPCGLRSEA
jgi:hypothetical protein